MSKKKYGLGIIVGRFQILHKGHSEIIKKAIELCDEVGILVGSSEESGTYKNPFSYEERKEFLLKAFPNLKVYPLPDIGVGNCRAWGDYVLENVEKNFGRKPDVFISGDEERRESWFGDDILEVNIPKTIDISASKMKEFIIDDNKAKWNEYIEPALRGRYEFIRERINNTKDNLETKSL